MEAISVAIALQSGEIASRTVDLVESHPLLELCGVARSTPDLLRLLDRFHPTALLISSSMLEDLETPGPGSEDTLLMNSPLTFILSSPEMNWKEGELDKVLHHPFRYCGFISRDMHGGEELFGKIKQQVSIYSLGETRQAGLSGRGSKRKDTTDLITVTGAKGGVGATLISCTLAAALSSTGRRVILMDLDSDLSQLLHLKPKDDGKTAVELLPMAEEISWDLVRVSIHRHPAGFHLLPYGQLPEDISRSSVEITETFLRNLLFLFDMVILDFPRPLRKDFLPLLRRSPMVLLTSLPDTLSARCAMRTTTFLRRTGLDHNHLKLIVNRCGSHHALRPEELANAAGAGLLASIPEDNNTGMDFAELAELPDTASPFGRAVAGMAASLGFEIDLPRQTSLLHRIRPPRKRNERGVL